LLACARSRGSNCSPCMKRRVSSLAIQSSLTGTMSGVVFIQCHEVIWDEMQPPSPTSHLSLPSPPPPPHPALFVAPSPVSVLIQVEATLATTRSLEKSRRTGVRILFYTCSAAQLLWSPPPPHTHTHHISSLKLHPKRQQHK